MGRSRSLWSLFALTALCATPVSAQAVINATLTTSGASCSLTVVRTSVEGVETGNCVTINMRNSPSVGVQVTFLGTGTVVFQKTNGTYPVDAADDLGGVTSTSSGGFFVFTNPGFARLIIRATSNSSSIKIDVSRGGSGLRSTATIGSIGDVTFNTAGLATSSLQATANTYLATQYNSIYATGGVTLQRVGVFNSSGVQIDTFSGGGGGGGGLLTSDPDDNSIAFGQTNSNVNVLNYVSNGTVWVRELRGTAGSPAGPVQSVQGVSGGTAMPVTGAFYQSIQPVSFGALPTGSNTIGNIGQAGTWTIQPGNTANTTPWLFSLRDGTNSAVTDNTAHAVKIISVASDGGTLIPTIECGSSVTISTSAAGRLELVPATSGQKIYVCGYNWMAGGTTGTALVRGTGTNCAGSPVTLAGTYPTTAQTGVAYGNGSGIVTSTAAGDALCFSNGSAIPVGGIVTYTKF